jgi:hypothetical protein
LALNFAVILTIVIHLISVFTFYPTTVPVFDLASFLDIARTLVALRQV